LWGAAAYLDTVVWIVRFWSFSEVAARLIEVRSLGRGELDLLTLSSSHFDLAV